MKILKLIPTALIILLLAGCNGCNQSKSREKPDVSGIHLDVKLMRFDRDLFDFRNKDYDEQVSFMRGKYGPFYDFYIDHFVVGPHPAGDTAHVEHQALDKFLADTYIKRLQDSINYHYKDTRDIEQDLTLAFKYFKFYFPKAEIPKVAGVNSGFALGAFTYGKDMLGIGLDLYMGPDNIDYDSAGIYKYLQHKMCREYIARNSMEALYDLYFGGDEMQRGETLIEGMVEKGKKMYFLSYMLPDAPDSVIVGFTDNQTKWCAANEYEIWKFLNDKDMLYKNNYMDQKRYLDEGPTTPGMPAESPGNIGSWIGLQIVNKFMRETDHKISLKDLVLKYDAKTILNKAKYRPSKPVF
jgi:hypothetical protein